MAIIEEINNGIKEAIKSKNQLRLDTLRMLKSKILAVDARCNISDAEVQKIFKTYYGNIQEAAEQAVSVGRAETAEKLKQELVIIQEFLPKALSLEETRRIIEEAVRESGAKSKKELGLVMKAAMKINSAIDGKLAKDIAFELLSD